MPSLAENIFYSFRRPGEVFKGDSIAGGKLTKNFDEPTYWTFYVNFRPANTNLEFTNYDKMPHPLFENVKPQDDINARNFYSTRQFLRDSNEFVREQMLIEFIEKWNVLQSDFQWYFQNISGIDSLLKVDPKRGIRVPKDGKVTIKMLEGLDMRVSHLLNLYKKIAWDDVYQRWILPDMMRYFMMDIYITEFRIFHQSNLKYNQQTQTEQGVYPPKQTIFQQGAQRLGFGTGNKFQSTEVPEMILTIMDDLMPTYVLHCERCEFDITSLNSQFNDLNVSEPQMAEVSFDVNVGNLTEEYRNPLLNFYYTDRIINGFERTQELEDVEMDLSRQTSFGPIPLKITQKVPYTPLKVGGNTKATTFIHPDVDYNLKSNHTSGKPFIQTGGSGESNLSNASKATTQGPTWVGNTIKFGKAFAENLFETGIDKIKTARIPGLNVSFSEALSAIQSKNIFTVFGLVRQSMTLSLNGTLGPSKATNGELIIDNQFRAFVQEVAKLDKSEATDNDVKLAKAANQILNNRGIWEQIKDMSKATDLLSKALGEVNMGKPIENPNSLKLNAEAQTLKDRSKATDLDGTPSLIGEPLVYRDILLSTSTVGNLEISKAIITTKLGSTDKEIQKSDFNGATGTIEGEIQGGEFSGSKPNTGIQPGGVERVQSGTATSKDGLQPAEFNGPKPNTGIQPGGVERVQAGAATSKDGLQSAEFSGSKPNTGIQGGGFNEVAPSLATSKKDIVEKGSFSGSKPDIDISEGGLPNSDISQATNEEIQNGKYLFGGVAKKQEIIKKSMERPEPGEAVDNDTKLVPIPRPELKK